jgi:hypothetical protein
MQMQNPMRAPQDFMESEEGINGIRSAAGTGRQQLLEGTEPFESINDRRL